MKKLIACLIAIFSLTAQASSMELPAFTLKADLENPVEGDVLEATYKIMVERYKVVGAWNDGVSVKEIKVANAVTRNSTGEPSQTGSMKYEYNFPKISVSPVMASCATAILTKCRVYVAVTFKLKIAGQETQPREYTVNAGPLCSYKYKRFGNYDTSRCSEALVKEQRTIELERE